MAPRQLKIAILLLLSLWGGTHTYAQLNTERITAIGRNALYFEDYVLSIQYFNQVIKLKPYIAEPYQLRAIAKTQLGDYNGALLDCNRAIELNPFQPGAYYTRGYVYRQLRQFAEAEQDLSQALIFSPENKTYLLLRADVMSEQKQYKQALADIDYLLRREPHSASLLFERGVICMNQQDTMAALDAFSQTVLYDSQNPSNWSAIGVTQLMLNQDDEALVAITKAINLGSKWPGDYMNRGIIFYHKHNYRGALADYDKAVSIDPLNAQSYYNRGMLRHELGDYNRAIDDYNEAISLAPKQTEMRYQRAVTQMQLRHYQDAIRDLDILIDVYPYFLPSYYLAAQAKSKLGDERSAYQYRHRAYELEQNKDKIQQQINTSVQIAATTPEQRDLKKEFSSSAAQQQNESMAGVVSEPNYALTYYAPTDEIRKSTYFHYAVGDFNRANIAPSPLHFSAQDLTLTAELINHHFELIASLSDQIERAPAAALCFARAMQFALVQDYVSAMDDATKALNLLATPTQKAPTYAEAVITFCRANWRFRMLQFQRAAGELSAESSMDFDIMLRDYDRVISLYPDFQFAYYNKANMLCQQRDYSAAITYYTRAIQIDADFAEAYFNRGLTYIYTHQTEAGLQDLSKAGELGISRAYQLITKFK